MRFHRTRVNFYITLNAYFCCPTKGGNYIYFNNVY